jgi:signal transduction histidine kinase
MQPQHGQRRYRVTGSLVFLLLSIGIVAVAVAEVHRAAKSQRAVADRVLREYATFAGWSYQQHLREAFDEITDPVLGAVHMGGHVHENPPIPLAAELPHMLPWDPDCYCHVDRYMPASLFAFTLGADTLGVASNTYQHPELGWLVDTIIEAPELPAHDHRIELIDYDEGDRRWIVETLQGRIRERWQPEWDYGLVVGGPSGTKGRVLVYTIMRTSWGDTIVYGSEYTQATLKRLFADIVDQKGLLPEPFTREHETRDLLTVEVTDRAGEPLFRSTARPDWDLDASTTLPAWFDGVRIRTEIRPEVAGDLVIGGLPRSRLPLLLALLGVAAALAVIAVRQLRREQELARLRSDFVSSVSHELRTPLAQIRLFLETLRLGRFTTDAQREWSLGNIDRETLRLAHLVENVLAFARGSRAVGAAPVETNVSREVRQAVEAFEPLARARRARLRLTIEDDVHAHLDAEALRQILTNLLDNAVKYGPAGQTVTVGLARADGRGRITVDDEGPGVAPAERTAIWDPFYRGAAAATSAGGGSGIGLSIVRDLAARQNATAAIADAPSGGARFIVDFPSAPEPVGAPAATGTAAQSDGG